MNTFRWCLKITQLLVFAAVISPGNSTILYAQGTGTVPVVTVKATQPFATATNPGVFTVFRAGNTNMFLNIWYDLGGMASNGVDYAMIPPHLVSMAAGMVSNTIIIKPITNSPSGVARTVVLTLTNSPMETPVNFEIGSPSEAVVYLRNGHATNLPPAVGIVAPKNGSVYYTPTNIQLFAKANDPDGSIANVEFFAGTTDLGKGNLVTLDPPGVNGVTGLVYFF
ncbi:MAG: hypothetical protein JF609_11995, partial [Verrucomicrobia bacterium]|nr:hypothetical protein [Verrucomicrobiota bacterium]